MIFTAEIDVMPRTELLDPQGKAVMLGLHNLQLDQVQEVRIGKHITLRLEAPDQETARSMVDEACRQLLANLIMESYRFELSAQ